MSEIQLNKPLYKPQPPENTATVAEAPPLRGPQPSIVARAAAVLADLLLLHFFCLLLVKFVPDMVAGLGPISRVVGVLIAIIYLGFGFSRFFLGRTFGKLLTRVQVLDLDQRELVPGKALQRAGTLLWPLITVAVVTPLLDQYYNSGDFETMATVFYGTTFLALAWFGANFIHIAVHPFKRSIVDVLSGTMIANTDGDPVQTRAWFASAKESAAGSSWHRSALFAAVTVAVFVFGIGIMLILQTRKVIEAGSDSYERIQAFLQDMEHPEFGVPYIAPADPERFLDLMNNGEGTTWTLPVTAQYWIRQNVSATDPEVDEATSTGLSRLEDLVVKPSSEALINEMIGSVAQRRLRSQLGSTSAPATLYLEVSVAETADLLFARDRVAVKSRSKLIDFITSQTVELP